MIMNQAAVCGQHLNNVVVYAPCFHLTTKWLASRRRAPTGSISAACAKASDRARPTDIFGEGLQLRSLKVYSQG
jgi:N-methylhydantoinase B